MNMTTQERYNDIVKRSGLSEEIVRRVIGASAESLAESIKQGEKATLPGICSLIPERGHRLLPSSGEGVNYAVEYSIIAKASQAMQSKIREMKEVDKLVKEEDSAENVRINQIQSLV